MDIRIVPDYTSKGPRVEVAGECVGCKSPGALIVSDGTSVTVVHFADKGEISKVMEALRKGHGNVA